MAAKMTSREMRLIEAGGAMARAVAVVLEDVEWCADSPTQKMLRARFAAWVRAVDIYVSANRKEVR